MCESSIEVRLLPTWIKSLYHYSPCFSCLESQGPLSLLIRAGERDSAQLCFIIRFMSCRAASQKRRKWWIHQNHGRFSWEVHHQFPSMSGKKNWWRLRISGSSFYSVKDLKYFSVLSQNLSLFNSPPASLGFLWTSWPSPGWLPLTPSCCSRGRCLGLSQWSCWWRRSSHRCGSCRWVTGLQVSVWWRCNMTHTWMKPGKMWYKI